MNWLISQVSVKSRPILTASVLLAAMAICVAWLCAQNRPVAAEPHTAKPNNAESAQAKVATPPESKAQVAAQPVTAKAPAPTESPLAADAPPAAEAPAAHEAPNEVETQPIALTAPQQGVLPTDELKAVLDFRDPKGGSRKLGESGIYPKAGGNPDKEFFHRPTFALISIDTAESSAPGMKTLFVRYALSDESARKAAETLLMQKWGVEAKVWPWPVTGRVIYVLKYRSGEVLAKSVQVVGSREQIEFTIDVPAKIAKRLQTTPELFQADFYYSTVNIAYAKGMVSIKGSKNISIAVRDVLASRDETLRNKDLTGQVVIGDEHSQLERAVAAHVEKTTEFEHQEALPLLEKQTPILVDRLIASMGTDEVSYDTILKQLDRVSVETALRKYLEPRIALMNESRSGDESEVKINESGKTEGSGLGLSIITSVIGLGGSSQSTDRTLERLEKATGMSWAFNKSEQKYVPHMLKISRVRKGYDTVEFNEKSLVFVPLAASSGMLVSVNVPLSFTELTARDSLNGQGLFDAVDYRIGTFVITMSNSPPGVNYVPADGVAKFGTEAFVPAELRGRHVPNLDGALLAFDSKGLVSGERVEGVALDKPHVINGNVFTLPAPSSKRIAEGEGNATNGHFRGGLVAIFHANGDYLDVKHHTAHCNAFGGRHEFAPATYNYHPENTVLKGSTEIPAPTHAKLRAYVRVR